MTNVLIGIIGVILFIGLALAGAFYLGPRFQQASNNSKAMSLAQMETQITAAISLKRNEDGVPLVARASVGSLSDGGYLKALPFNPFVGQGGLPFRALYSGDLTSSGYYADVVIASMGSAVGTSDVCRALNRQTNGTEEVPELASSEGTSIRSVVTRTAGCFRMHKEGIYGEAAGNDYVAYAKI
jgi:hypothetical protein